MGDNGRQRETREDGGRHRETTGDNGRQRETTRGTDFGPKAALTGTTGGNGRQREATRATDFGPKTALTDNGRQREPPILDRAIYSLDGRIIQDSYRQAFKELYRTLTGKLFREKLVKQCGPQHKS